MMSLQRFAACWLLSVLFIAEVASHVDVDLGVVESESESESVSATDSTSRNWWENNDGTFSLEDLRIEHRDHTFADINKYRTLDMSLTLDVNMESRSLVGYVETTFVKLKPSWMIREFGKLGPSLVLDIGPHVTVTEVMLELGEGRESGMIDFKTFCDDQGASTDTVLNCALLVKDPIPEPGQFKLRIYYSVTEKTSSLHFVPPYQTHENNHYFLVTNTQPSNSRGWIPCQDTPALKFPYIASIRVKHPFTVLMSAILTEEKEDTWQDSEWKTVSFKQDIPVAPFLIAITVADIVSVDVRQGGEVADLTLPVVEENHVDGEGGEEGGDGLGEEVVDEDVGGEGVEAADGENDEDDDTKDIKIEKPANPAIRVWGERSVMNKVGPSGILELIPRMMEICEAKYGRYDWGRYDIVLAPPGYMFKGMEFPGMNYISSTVLDFEDLDKPNYSFATIIAHEMVHSWFGNLVTPKYAGDVWLAEGITSYEELELVEDYYDDPKIGNYLRRSRYSSLHKAIEGYTGAMAKYKILTPYLHDLHPWYGFTFIHYLKGGLFLEYLANQTSRADVNTALSVYLDLYKYQSVDTADFVHMLYQQFGFHENKEIERDIFVWLERPHTEVPIGLFPSELYDDSIQMCKVLTKSKSEAVVEWTWSDIAEAYSQGTGVLASKAGHLRSQMTLVLERMGRISSKIQKSENKVRMKHWRRLVNRLDKVFKFTEMTQSDPETFATWASFALKFNHTATMEKMPAFFKQNARLELVFAVLDAPTDMRLRGVFANILRTDYDVDMYPGYIGYLLKSYVEYFIRFFEEPEP